MRAEFKVVCPGSAWRAATDPLYPRGRWRRGPTTVRCSGCGRQCFGSVDDLRLVVERELRGRIDEHIGAGAVVVSC